MKVLIATLYNPDPVILACTKLNVNRLILLIDEEPDKTQQNSLELIQNSLGRVIDIKPINIPVYDIVGIASEVVKTIDMQPRDDQIFINITSGRKTQAFGVLFGAYARSKLVKKIAYSPDEDKNQTVYLPVLSFRITETVKKVLDELNKKKYKNINELANAMEISSAMVYRNIEELKEKDFIEINDEGIILTDMGRIARL
jgi:CRISPR-associated protein Csa3